MEMTDLELSQSASSSLNSYGRRGILTRGRADDMIEDDQHEVARRC